MIFSIYIHIPFCKYKCYYCDFVSYPFIDHDLFDRYVKRLIEEIGWWHRLFPDATLYTAYIGGGTPSVLPLSLLEKIVDALHQWNSPMEFTIEANPDDISPEWVKNVISMGINRISVGIESLSEYMLKAWGRKHTVEDSLRSMDVLRGLSVNFNVDMIYPTYLPKGYSIEFEDELQRVLEFSPFHISIYMMDLHKGTMAETLVRKGQWLEVDDDVILNDMKAVNEILLESGFHHYEISNYAVNGYESLHNIVYWQQEFYIGVGVSAWGLISGVRYQNLPTLRYYLEGDIRRNYTRLVGKEWLVDYGLMALRLINRGIQRFRWQQLGGNWEELIDRAKEIDCVDWSSESVFLKDDVACVMVSTSIIEEMLEPWL